MCTGMVIGNLLDVLFARCADEVSERWYNRNFA